MKKRTYRFGIVLRLLVAGFVLLASMNLVAQSLVSGDIAGTVTDSSKAVIPNITVKLKSLDTGADLTAKTNAVGAYRFTLLKPGTYKLTIAETGFAVANEIATVTVGQITTANLALKVTGDATVIEVTSVAPLLTTDASPTTSFTQKDLELLPSAGSDITNIASTSAGATVNTAGGGYGNFSVNGLSALSNLFTVNGENDMDPYFNLNNSGATNLTLGQNEIQEAAVITNAYGGQYGQLSGAQVTYVTKSGSNKFHGNANYYWNGRTLNANDWMNKNAGGDRPFSNNNQWATSVGGPIFKNKTFFFADYEGVKFVLPAGGIVTAPSPAFASAVLANVTAQQPNEVSAYTKLFNLYGGAAAHKTTSPVADNDCTAAKLASLAPYGFTPATSSDCAMSFSSTPGALGSEWILAARVDQHFTDKDTMYVRYKMDHGTQPTVIDPINAAFNAISVQPSWDIQANETHIFSPRSTNQFMATLSHYVAQFSQSQPLANNTFPYEFTTSGDVPFSQFNLEASFPQGRNITQYQFIDDYTLSLGRHNLKFGGNFRRYDVSDHNFFYNYPRVYFGYTTSGLTEFSNGLAYQYRQSSNAAKDVPIAMYGLGLYAEDEWNVKPNLKLTLAVRAEKGGNPVCNTGCFANFASAWSSLPSAAAGANSGSVPYNQDIKTGLKNAFPGVDSINISPRIGFSWSPDASKKTVVSGGVGIFFDGPPAGLLDDLLADPPVAVALRVRPAGGTPAFDPTATGSAATFQASAAAFSSGFKGGATYGQISSQLASMGVVFAPPAFTSLAGTFHSPQYQEWNLQIQQQIAQSTVLILNYVGNHGIHIPYANAWLNAYDEYGVFASPIIPQAPPNVNYGEVTQYQTGANSSYNGLNVSIRHQFTKAFTMHANYTWGHALDEVSNGGAFAYGSESLTTQILPGSLKGSYGNADYDVRHNFNMDYAYTPKINTSNKALKLAANGWQWTGKVFWRTGLPFSITDGGAPFGNGGGTFLAVPAPGINGQSSCGKGNASSSGTAVPCLNIQAFPNDVAWNSSPYSFPGFSTQERNQYRGPHYMDFDMGLAKNFTLVEGLNLGIGMQAFNVLNHPNFGLPNADVSSGTFGQIDTMIVNPTSPYGSGLGYSSTGRLLQLTAKITF